MPGVTLPSHLQSYALWICYEANKLELQSPHLYGSCRRWMWQGAMEHSR